MPVLLILYVRIPSDRRITSVFCKEKKEMLHIFHQNSISDDMMTGTAVPAVNMSADNACGITVPVNGDDNAHIRRNRQSGG